MRMVHLFVALGLASCSPREASPPASVSPDAEIMAASRAFSDAYVRGDTATIENLYTSDALLLPPGREVRGRRDIGAFFAPRPDRVQVSHSMTSEELKTEGNRAIDTGAWTNVWQPKDGPVQSASGRYLVVWRRGADGRWRIEYDMWHRPGQK